MKSVKMIIIAFAIFCFGNASAQKITLKIHDIPLEISNYITQNFKEHRIKKALKDVEDNTIEYEIILNKKVELEFDETFKIKEIEAKNGVPLNLIPLPIANYVQSHFPDLKILQWKLNAEGQEIELNNKTEVQFDVNGNYMKIENK